VVPGNQVFTAQISNIGITTPSNNAMITAYVAKIPFIALPFKSKTHNKDKTKATMPAVLGSSFVAFNPKLNKANKAIQSRNLKP
jgi:hypothetical protein